MSLSTMTNKRCRANEYDLPGDNRNSPGLCVYQVKKLMRPHVRREPNSSDFKNDSFANVPRFRDLVGQSCTAKMSGGSGERGHVRPQRPVW